MGELAQPRSRSGRPHRGRAGQQPRIQSRPGVRHRDDQVRRAARSGDGRALRRRRRRHARQIDHHRDDRLRPAAVRRRSELRRRRHRSATRRRQPIGQERSFVAEACEFDRSFHNLRPRVAIITNIEEDHLDCYKDIDEIVEAFRTFVNLVPADGLIIANGRTRTSPRRSSGRPIGERQTCGAATGEGDLEHAPHRHRKRLPRRRSLVQRASPSRRFARFRVPASTT